MKVRMRRTLAVLMPVMLLTGCGNFFVYPGSTSGSGGTGGGSGSGSGGYAYVANATTGTLAAYVVGATGLTAVANTPYTLGYSPVAMAINPANTILYVGSAGVIYAYAINAGGGLSVLNNGAPVAVGFASSMEVTPDGQWLLILDGNGFSIDEYQIDPSTGLLTQAAGATYVVGNAVVVPRTIQVAPNGNYVFAALGTAGDAVFAFNTTTGVLVQVQQLSLGATTTSDNALAVNNSSNYLYIARSGTSSGVVAYSIASNNGALSQVSGSPFAAGKQPYALAFDTTGNYLYAANRGDGTISAYSINSNGSLTTITGSPFASGSSVAGLAAESSGKYLLAIANGGSPDLSVYSFDATTAGKLNPVTTMATGVDPTGPVAVVTTH